MSQGYVSDAEKLVNGCVLLGRTASTVLSDHPKVPPGTWEESVISASAGLDTDSRGVVKALNNVVFNLSARGNGPRLLALLVDVLAGALQGFLGEHPSAREDLGEPEVGVGVYLALAAAVHTLESSVLGPLNEFLAAQDEPAVEVEATVDVASIHPAPEAESADEDNPYAGVVLADSPRMINLMTLGDWTAQMFHSVLLGNADPPQLAAEVSNRMAAIDPSHPAHKALSQLLSHIQS